MPLKPKKYKPGEVVEAVVAPKPTAKAYATFVAQGVPEKEAALLAGYSESYTPDKIERNNPEACAHLPEVRARLQAKRHLTLEDQTDIYRKVRDKEGEETGDRLKAAARLDKILGYEAPANAPTSTGPALTQVVQVINHYTSVMGMPVEKLMEELLRPGLPVAEEAADFEEIQEDEFGDETTDEEDLW